MLFRFVCICQLILFCSCVKHGNKVRKGELVPLYEDSVRRFYYTGGEVSHIFDFSTMYFFEYFKNGKRRKFGSFIISDSSYSKFNLLNDDYYKLLEKICPTGPWTILNTHGKVVYNGELQCLQVNSIDSCAYDDGFTEVFYVTDFKILE